jgi:parallel beta-helix repeat protein
VLTLTVPVAVAASSDPIPCINYKSSEKLIVITCKSATNLTDVNNQLQNSKILDRQYSGNNKVWLLKANLLIQNRSTFTIDPSDTTWLKIYSDGKSAYNISVNGSMKINAVKITSWNTKEKDYDRIDLSKSKLRPRAFIATDAKEQGTTNITNSEIAYLGYNSSKSRQHVSSNGLSYYGGPGSIIKGNNIHHNNFGFYSAHVGHLIIENNDVHDNTFYGLDPHSGTHDMIIRNNVVHDNGMRGIICSQHCRNITIEGNEVYRNVGSGIAFSINMTNSIARNNYVHDQKNDGNTGITISESNNNKVYGNTVSDCDLGIFVRGGASNNYIYNNTLKTSAYYAIQAVNPGTKNNTFERNYMENPIGLNNNTGSKFINNSIPIVNTTTIAKASTNVINYQYAISHNSSLNLERTNFPIDTVIRALGHTNNTLNISNSGTIKVRENNNNTHSNITRIYDTNNSPFSTKLSHTDISIISLSKANLTKSSGVLHFQR